MVKAVVGANWGDEGKGKITDVFREEPTQDILLRIIMVSSLFIHYLQVCFIITPQASLAMV